MSRPPQLGRPRLHLRCADSTNERARELAIAGAPHGTLVSATEQTAGRGRQGRSWEASPGDALLCSIVLRDPPALLSLIAAVAVCDSVGETARVKWPNDVVVEASGGCSHPSTTTPAGPSGEERSHRSTTTSTDLSGGESPRTAIAGARALRKLAGILVEGRPQEGWAVLGIGVNVAVRVQELPMQLRERAASLELAQSAIEPLMSRLIQALERRLGEPSELVLDAWRARDALHGREVSWEAHHLNRTDDDDGGGGGRGDEGGRSVSGRQVCHGQARGIDDAGCLIVRLAGGGTTKLDAGEVHLGSA